LSAASNYGASFVPKEAPFITSKKCGVYTHDVQDGEFYDAQELDTASELTYNIDTSVDTLQAHAHQQRAQPKSSSVMLGLPTSRMTRDKWFKLTPEARQIWDQLDDHSKAVILAPAEWPNSNFKCKVNLHEISAYDYLLANQHSSSDCKPLEPDTTTDTVVSDSLPPEDTSQALINAAKQTKPSQNPDDICRVLSSTMAWPPPSAPQKPDEMVINGKTYQQVNIHNTYSVSASCSSATQLLVDHGANGGIGGSDVRIIYKTHHSVDVQGINNHQMTDIPIATVGGVINTQHDEVIAIMHQYAYTGIGTSIHSSVQLEWYKNDVND